MASIDSPPPPIPDTRLPARQPSAEDAAPRRSEPRLDPDEPPLDTLDAQKKRFNDYLKLHGTQPLPGEKKQKQKPTSDDPDDLADAEQPEGEDEAKAEGDEPEVEGDEDADEEQEDDEADPKAKVKANALERAITALRRAQVPQSVLKKMTQGEIMAMAESHHARQAERDNLKREFEELKTAKQSTQSKKEPATHGEPAASPFNLDELVAPFAEQFDDNTSKAMREYSTRLTKAVNDHVKTANAQNEQQLAFLGNILSDVVFEGARQRLLESFPQLKNDKSTTAVKAKMHTLLATGDYAHMPVTARIAASLEDALRVLYPKSGAPVVSKSMKNGSSTTKSNSTKGQPTKLIDKQRLSFNLVSSGKYSVAQARSLAGLD